MNKIAYLKIQKSNLTKTASSKSGSDSQKRGVHFREGWIFILKGVLTNTYILIHYISLFFCEQQGILISNQSLNYLMLMIVHLPTGKSFVTQKEAKLYFGNHHYRRLVKKGDIYFTNYNTKVANDPIQKNN